MRQNRRSAGFTLIELLMALAIAGLVAVLGAVVLRAAIDFHGRATTQLRESENLRAADRLLARDWLGRRDQDLVAMPFELEFYSDRLFGVGTQGAARVRYLCSRHEDGTIALERQLLVREEAARPMGSRASAQAAETWRLASTETLAPRLRGCSFAYLATRESREGKVAEWRAEVIPGEPVPVLLRLRLSTERGAIAPLVYRVEG